MASLLASLMVTMSLVSAGPELIAHRGESADAPENTLAAFRLAWERKVPAIELDVHLTKDGRLAVCHDFDTKRCAGVACKIRESLWGELKDLDVGQRFNPRFTGEKLPLLEDALVTIPAGARFSSKSSVVRRQSQRWRKWWMHAARSQSNWQSSASMLRRSPRQSESCLSSRRTIFPASRTAVRGGRRPPSS